MRTIMRLIDIFVEHALSDETSFTISCEREGYSRIFYYTFLVQPVGNAKLIYGAELYEGEDLARTDNKLELWAIVSDGIVYSYNYYGLSIWKNEDKANLPEKHEFFEVARNIFNEKIKKEIFPAFIETIIPNSLSEEEVKECNKTARELLLESKEAEMNTSYIPAFDNNDFVKILCGKIIPEKEFLERLMKDKSNWIKRKSKFLAVQEAMEKAEIVEPWELDMAKGINSVDAKSVNVTFELNGKTTTSKFVPYKLLSKLKDRNDYFSDFDFPSRVEGKKVLDLLGAADSRWSSDKPLLKAEHILKITYGKKILYAKNKNDNSIPFEGNI